MKTLIVEAKDQKELATVQAVLKALKVLSENKSSYDQYISVERQALCRLNILLYLPN